MKIIANLLSLLIFASANIAHGAYCSLRDPVTAIKTLYHNTNQYRSIVAPITNKSRDSVKDLLPFTLHRSEIGKHTLYMVLDNNKPTGFVQARSELAEWGLIEIAWGINFDMTINGLFFQRCRSPKCNQILSNKLNNLLKDRSFKEIRSMLSEDGTKTASSIASKFSESNDIALLAIRSALKTIAITEITWKKEITEITGIK
ncbi:MAG: hypothetical protein KZQ92_21200 [Candidatus Thiodiazotropha sp. (ex Lucinoma borealis)]|nr:hypothetical protein [Candidatus Thiodiazotropha sp. (ex Lucinoma borealis)]